MKTIKQLSIAVLTLLFIQFSACGEIKVKADIDDDDLDTISNIFDDADDSESSDPDDTDNTDDTDEVGTEVEENSDDEEIITDEEEDTQATDIESNDNSTDDKGGQINNSQKGTNRTFIGTYSLDAYYSSCDNRYVLPANIRGFSHGDLIDFEDSSGYLVWIARLFVDDTFDFSALYLDKFGNPTITLACTCEIKDGYYSYYNDEINCNCEGTDSYNTCKIYYDKY